jgi:hypothetical protein
VHPRATCRPSRRRRMSQVLEEELARSREHAIFDGVDRSARIASHVACAGWADTRGHPRSARASSSAARTLRRRAARRRARRERARGGDLIERAAAVKRGSAARSCSSVIPARSAPAAIRSRTIFPTIS